MYLLKLAYSTNYDITITYLFRKVNLTSTQSRWAEVPTIVSMFPQESVEVPGVVGGKQTSWFYEPLCVSVAPEPSQDFYYLVTGTVQPCDR